MLDKIVFGLINLVVGVLGVLAVCAFIAITLAPFWLMGSIITSGLKKVEKKCGTEYVIERYYIAGDLFCEDKK